MKTQMTATLVSGVLKPDECLAFPDRTRLMLTIEPIVEQPQSAAAWQSLINRLKQRPVHAGSKKFTRDELYERD